MKGKGKVVVTAGTWALTVLTTLQETIADCHIFAKCEALTAMIPVFKEEVAKFKPLAETFKQNLDARGMTNEEIRNPRIATFISEAYRPLRTAVLDPLLPQVAAFGADFAAHYSQVPGAVKADPDFRDAYLSLIQIHTAVFDSAKGSLEADLKAQIAQLEGVPGFPPELAYDQTRLDDEFIPLFQTYLKLRSGFSEFERYVLKLISPSEDGQFQGKVTLEKHAIQWPSPVPQTGLIEVPVFGAPSDPAAIAAIQARIEEKKALLANGEVTEETLKAQFAEYTQREKQLKAQFEEEGGKAGEQYERMTQLVSGLSDDLLSISSALLRAGEFFSDDDFAALREGLLTVIQEKTPVDDDTMAPIRKRLDQLFRKHPPA
jgi:hypothetical protein